jgi:cysteinyl-tRNA synthetase
VVVRRSGSETAFEKGDTFAMDVLRGKADTASAGSGVPVGAEPVETTEPADEEASFWHRVRALEGEFERALSAHEPQVATRVLLDVDYAVWQASQDLAGRETISQAREVLRDMIVMVGTRLNELPPSAEACLAPVVQRLLALRAQCKARKQWEQADAIRGALQAAGVTVEDTPDGPRWRMGEAE